MKHKGLQAFFFVCIFLLSNHMIFAQTDGYVSSMSVSQGEKLCFYISTPLTKFDLKIYKLGVFKKEMLTLSGLPGGIQKTDDSAFIKGCNWKVTKEIIIPYTWTSGIYEADIPSGGAIKKLIFIVKEKNLGWHSKTVVCLTANTWQAYNNWGGRSLYDFNSYSETRSLKVSFNRPLSDTAADYYFRWTDVLVKWLEANHFDAEFCTNTDLDADPFFLSHYKTFVTVGHDEYWSRPERSALEIFLKFAGRIICLSGNTCWWQVRFEDSLHTMVCYRDTAIDPMFGQHDSLVTSIWGRSPINEPPNSLLGVSFEHGGFINDDGIFPQYLGYGGYTIFNSNHWIYYGTGLKDGDIIGAENAIAGYESDGALFEWDRGFPTPTGEDKTPKNFSILGISPAASAANLPYGHATMGCFTSVNGGAVFNGGSTDWVRGLDEDDSVLSHILFNIFWRFTSVFDLPPVITSFSPVRVTQDSINHEWVNLNHVSMRASPNSIDTFVIHAVQHKAKKLLYSWRIAGKTYGSDSIFILTPEVKKTLPKAYALEGAAVYGFDKAAVTWSLLDTTIRIVSSPIVSSKRQANYIYQPFAASLLDEHPTYILIYGPSWLIMDPKGVLRGTTGDKSGTETVIIRASDSKGNYDFQTFNINISDSLEAKVTGNMTAHVQLQTFPNPVNNEAHFLFTLQEASYAEMEISDVMGVHIRSLSGGSELSEGAHLLHWDRTDENGKRVAEGMYFCKLLVTSLSGKKELIVRKIVAK